ncbi:MAG: sulfite exporter TauE/SafE family protein [Acidobacteria bacterium]|nr:sulfite exporter TauE/SafE family protein [Acidobacteriota bacterium]
MNGEILVLCWTALCMGVLHTLAGPDHYLPFVMLSRARRWSRTRLILVTAACGFGHILSSVALGLAGIAAGVAIGRLEGIESVRGDLASWLLLGFGLAYAAWGIRRGARSREHTHEHRHAAGDTHSHTHDHLHDAHLHPHPTDARGEDRKRVTVWALFVIFVLGPCEPLIPLVMVPASHHSWGGVVLVSSIFGVATVATMTVATLLLESGIKRLSTRWMERYMHALAGAVIALSGASILFLGL